MRRYVPDARLIPRPALKADARRQTEIATGQRNKIFREGRRPAGDNIENIVRRRNQRNGKKHTGNAVLDQAPLLANVPIADFHDSRS